MNKERCTIAKGRETKSICNKITVFILVLCLFLPVLIPDANAEDYDTQKLINQDVLYSSNKYPYPNAYSFGDFTDSYGNQHKDSIHFWCGTEPEFLCYDLTSANAEILYGTISIADDCKKDADTQVSITADGTLAYFNVTISKDSAPVSFAMDIQGSSKVQIECKGVNASDLCCIIDANLGTNNGDNSVKKLRSASIGDCIVFGRYEQDNNTKNGPNEDSSNGCECWRDPTLRNWLNSEFFSSAFSNTEQLRIPTVNVPPEFVDQSNVDSVNDKNSRNSLGWYTSDKIFLLSVEEVHNYISSDTVHHSGDTGEKKFSEDNVLVCAAPTQYSISKGADTSNTCSVGGKPTSDWWLRTVVLPPDSMVYPVNSDGSIFAPCLMDECVGGVRPAMWIDVF